MFRRFREVAPEQPIYHRIFGWGQVGDLLDRGRTQDAIAFRDFYREANFNDDEMYLEWGQTFLRLERRELATDCFKKALLQDPSNREAADKLKEASGSK
jgi:tetratricopeptide (TPR) repeat protein